MPPRIGTIRIEQVHLDPAEADLKVAVAVEDAGPATEVRGRWVGPRCALRSTVDVAYPLRRVESGYGVLIPEPAMWEPASPFLYSAIIELWDGEQRLDRHTVEHALRTLALTSKGLRCNHKPLELRGVIRRELEEAAARRLKEQGVNLLMTDGDQAALAVAAERFGFLLLRQEGLRCKLTTGGEPILRLEGSVIDADFGDQPPADSAFVMGKQADRWELRTRGGQVFGTIAG